MTITPESALHIVFPAPGEVDLVEYPLPPPIEQELQTRTLYSLVSTGTETTILHGRYAADSHFARMFSFPQRQTGVQSVAVVEQVGDAVVDFRPGDTVYIRQGHGHRHVVPEEECSPVPAGVDLHQACWCGLAKTAFRAAWAGGFSTGNQVLIIGAGPVGQMAVRWAAALGCDRIAVVDMSARRLQFAREGGATHCLEGAAADLLREIADLDGGPPPPLVIDSTGNPAAFRAALAAAAPFGKVVLLGDTGYPERQCLSSDLMIKGLTLQATHDSHDRDGWTQRRVDALFFDTLLEGRFPLEGLISHSFAPEQCREAYRVAEQERLDSLGILFDWTAMENPCP